MERQWKPVDGTIHTVWEEPHQRGWPFPSAFAPLWNTYLTTHESIRGQEEGTEIPVGDGLADHGTRHLRSSNQFRTTSKVRGSSVADKDEKAKLLRGSL